MCVWGCDMEIPVRDGNCSASFQVLQGRHSHRRDGGQRLLFQRASETTLAWKESRPKTDLS